MLTLSAPRYRPRAHTLTYAALRSTEATAFAVMYQDISGQNPMPFSRLGSEVPWWVTAAASYGGPAAFGE